MGAAGPDTPPRRQPAASEQDAHIANLARAEAVQVTREGIETYDRDVLPGRLAAITRKPDGGPLTEDELLRRQCLEWAFQTREFSDVPHMQVVAVAGQYYNFIRNKEANQTRVACTPGKQAPS